MFGLHVGSCLTQRHCTPFDSRSPQDTYGYVKQGGDILKLVKTAFTLGKSKCCKGSQKQMATTTITAAETSATVDTPSSAEEGEVAAASSNAADVAAASDAAGDSKV